MAEKKCLLVIDSNSLIHRAFHALPPLTAKEGELVNAVYGFLLVFFRVLKDFQPDFIAAAFDLPAPTFRHKKFKEYKAKRPPTPKELSSQIPKVKEVLRAFNVPVFEKQGFEADDIIGTIAKKAPSLQQHANENQKIETIIVSGDLDTLQLVDPNTKNYTLRRGLKDAVLYDEKLVKEKYQGLTPSQILDFKGLKGDPSDNIPGVAGVGEKTAIKLISEFGSLESLYEEIKKETQKAKGIKPKLRETLVQSKEQAFLSKMLVTIKQDVPIDFNLKKCQWKDYDRNKVIKIFVSLSFKSLISRLPGSEIEKQTKSGVPKIGDNLTIW